MALVPPPPGHGVLGDEALAEQNLRCRRRASDGRTDGNAVNCGLSDLENWLGRFNLWGEIRFTFDNLLLQTEPGKKIEGSQKCSWI